MSGSLGKATAFVSMWAMDVYAEVSELILCYIYSAE